VVRMAELNPVPIDQADGCAGAECRDRELLQEVLPNLQICVLQIRLACPGSCGFLLNNGTPRSQLVMHFRRLPDRFRWLIRAALLGSSNFRH